MLNRKRLVLGGVLAAGVALMAATSGIPAPTPNPPGTFSFGVLGDGPYYAIHGEALQYRLVLQELNAHDLDARAALAGSLLESLEAAADEDAEAACATEVNRRIAEHDSGAVEIIPWAEVRRRLAAR